MKLLNLLMIFQVVFTLVAGNSITPILESGVWVQKEAVAWGNPAIIEGDSAEQAGEAGVDAKKLTKRIMDLGIIFALSPIWVPVFAVLYFFIFFERVLLWDFGPVFITEPRFSMGKKFNMLKINFFRERARRIFLESPEFKKEPTFNYLHRDSSNLLLIGRFMKKGWDLKRELSKKITNTEIEEMYHQALKSGALGGKICGAGGGGFLMLYVPRESQNSVREAMRDYREFPFMLNDGGSKIMFNSSSGGY